MDLHRDDWVKTPADEVGKVIHTSETQVYVAHVDYPKPDRVEAYRENELTRIARPERA